MVNVDRFFYLKQTKNILNSNEIRKYVSVFVTIHVITSRMAGNVPEIAAASRCPVTTLLCPANQIFFKLSWLFAIILYLLDSLWCRYIAALDWIHTAINQLLIYGPALAHSQPICIAIAIEQKISSADKNCHLPISNPIISIFFQFQVKNVNIR